MLSFGRCLLALFQKYIKITHEMNTVATAKPSANRIAYFTSSFTPGDGFCVEPAGLSRLGLLLGAKVFMYDVGIIIFKEGVADVGYSVTLVGAPVSLLTCRVGLLEG